LRICSLLPAATETLFALGLGANVVAVSHECDQPPEARSKPRATTTTVDPAILSSAEIDALVSQTLAGGASTYHVDLDVLRRTRPELIVTQDLCAVCAIDGGEVRRAASTLNPVPRVVTISPTCLEDILDSIARLGEWAGAPRQARELVDELRTRLDAVRASTSTADRPRVVCLEWLDPPWLAGHWMPELVEVAGGVDALGIAAEPSRRATWAEIKAARPEVLILMPCGFDVPRTLQELDVLCTVPEVADLPAVRSGRVFAVDGSRYFNRPGPSIAEGAELLAGLLSAPPRLERSSAATQVHLRPLSLDAIEAQGRRGGLL